MPYGIGTRTPAWRWLHESGLDLMIGPNRVKPLVCKAELELLAPPGAARGGSGVHRVPLHAALPALPALSCPRVSFVIGSGGSSPGLGSRWRWIGADMDQSNRALGLGNCRAGGVDTPVSRDQPERPHPSVPGVSALCNPRLVLEGCRCRLGLRYQTTYSVHVQ